VQDLIAGFEELTEVSAEAVVEGVVASAVAASGTRPRL
jgi:hypothetical protein